MKFKFLCITAATCLTVSLAHATPEYDKKMSEYQVHLKQMKTDTDDIIAAYERLDKSSQACLDAIEADKKSAGPCMLMRKDDQDFKHKYKEFQTYNRIRKVPKFERKLQGMMEREMFSLPKKEAAMLFKTHMDGKTARQEHITKLGEMIYSTIDKYNSLSDDRLEKIKNLKKK